MTNWESCQEEINCNNIWLYYFAFTCSLDENHRNLSNNIE